MTLYAMQYELTLPADHDMGALRERARLGLKTYLFRDNGTNGYLRHDTAMMADLPFTGRNW